MELSCSILMMHSSKDVHLYVLLSHSCLEPLRSYALFPSLLPSPLLPFLLFFLCVTVDRFKKKKTAFITEKLGKGRKLEINK